MEHKTRTKVLSWLLSLALTLGLLPALSSSALADEVETTYTLTIPSTLTVANSGWNATGGISATGTLESGKKLAVTATSDDEFALVNQSDNTQKVGYILAATSEDTEATTSWEFTALPGSATLGIIVDDYSSKPAGTYQDTVTFTAKVENAVTAPTLAGVTLTDGMIIEPHCNVGGEDNWVQFKYVAADDKFVPNFNSYNDCYSKSGGSLMQQLADQWAMSTFIENEEPNGNFYLTQTDNTVHLRADDGINMLVIDLQLDFDNMTYTQLYKQWYNTVSGSFTSIKIGDTTITASQMTAN